MSDAYKDLVADEVTRGMTTALAEMAAAEEDSALAGSVAEAVGMSSVLSRLSALEERVEALEGSGTEPGTDGGGE